MKILTTLPFLLCGGVMGTQVPPTAFPTVPVELSSVTGYLSGTEVDDYWVASNKRFWMTSLKVWKDTSSLSGFETTFSQPASYSGWPDESHMFGSTSLTSHYEEFSFTTEILRISLCCQGCGNSIDSSFVVEGISVQQSDGTVNTAGVNACSEWTAFHLQDRLIGFRVKAATNWTFPLITPVVDTHSCIEEDTIDYASADIRSNEVGQMSCFVGGPPVLQNLTWV